MKLITSDNILMSIIVMTPLAREWNTNETLDVLLSLIIWCVFGFLYLRTLGLFLCRVDTKFQKKFLQELNNDIPKQYTNKDLNKVFTGLRWRKSGMIIAIMKSTYNYVQWKEVAIM